MITDAVKSMSYADKMLRHEQKRSAILEAVRKYGWTDVSLAADLLGLSTIAARQTLAAMVRDGLLTEQLLHGISPRPLRWYRLTSRGMLEALFLADLPIPDPMPESRYSLAPQNYRHDRDVIQIATAAEAAGAEFRQFEPPPAAAGKKNLKYPDGLLIFGGRTWGLEVEREPKSQRRYKDIVAAHLLAIQRKQYDSVLYVCPSKPTKARVKAAITSIQSVYLSGRDYKLQPGDLKRFIFGTYSQLPNFIIKKQEAPK